MTVRTGQEYVDSLKDQRQVWIAGERVGDIVSHPTLRRSIATIARLYDLQHDTAHRDLLTFCSSDGDECAISYLVPVTETDIERRRNAIKIYADETFGMMGRSPDFLNTAVMAFGAAADYFGKARSEFGKNAQELYKRCREKDLFLARATVGPPADRSKAHHDQKDLCLNLRVIRETSQGLTVRGAKLISTHAAIANEIIVFPLPGFHDGDDAYTASFTVPVATDGLRLICREPFDDGTRTSFDHPLGSRVEEIDCVCIFDDVFVPWDRVFFFGSADAANVMYSETFARNQTGHQGAVRVLAKTELLVGVAVALAESVRTNTFLHVQEMLGEAIGYIELVKGILASAERGATQNPWGTLCPAVEPIQALRYHFPRMNRRLVEIIQILGAGSLLATPTSRDLSSEIGADIRRYLGGFDENSRNRLALLKLAWDVCGDGLSQRQLIYERYHSGDPVRLAASQYRSYDLGAGRLAVERALRWSREPQLARLEHDATAAFIARTEGVGAAEVGS